MGCQSLLHDDVRDLFYGLTEAVNFYPVLQGKGCSATHLNSFLIGPLGELYKCWNELGDSKKIIGYINDQDFKNKDLIRKYVLSANCFEDENVRIANLYLFAWEDAPFIESRICLTMGILTFAHSTKITE